MPEAKHALAPFAHFSYTSELSCVSERKYIHLANRATIYFEYIGGPTWFFYPMPGETN